MRCLARRSTGYRRLRSRAEAALLRGCVCRVAHYIGRERKAKKVVLCARRLALNGRGRCDFGNRQETAMDAKRLAAVYLHIDTFMPQIELRPEHQDRKSTRLNSSH